MLHTLLQFFQEKLRKIRTSEHLVEAKAVFDKPGGEAIWNFSFRAKAIFTGFK